MNFQMIAGNNFNRNSTLPNPDPNPLGPWPEESQAQRAERAIGFNCLHYAAGNDERTLMRNCLPTKEFMDATCTDGIRLELQFPSCWNGQLDGGPTHKTHVAYPDGVITGNCPEGYDHRLVSLFYETIIATDQFAGKPGKFVLANGDPTGYGYHGDFIAAWKDGTLAAAINACNTQDSSGDMRACSTFTMTQDSAQCSLQDPLPATLAQENVKGPMQGMVNSHPIYAGPAPAPMPGKQGGGAPASSSAPPAEIPIAAAPSVSAPLASHSAEPMIGQVHEKIAAAASPSSTTVPSPAAAAPSPQSSTVSTSTQYDANGNVVMVIVEEVVVVEEHVLVTETSKKAKKRGLSRGAMGHQHHGHRHG